MPPHWFVPVRGSDPNDRKEEVKNALQDHGKLHSFWEGSDGKLYALVKDCPHLDGDDALKRNLKVAGGLTGLEKEI